MDTHATLFLAGGAWWTQSPLTLLLGGGDKYFNPILVGGGGLTHSLNHWMTVGTDTGPLTLLLGVLTQVL